jgi:hypothetical protein
MPTNKINHCIYYAPYQVDLLLSLVKVHHGMWDKAAVMCTGSRTYSSGMQVGFGGIGIVDCLMVLT